MIRNKERLLFVLVSLILILMTVGYAAYDKLLPISGVVTVKAPVTADVIVTSVNQISQMGATASHTNNFTDVDFLVTFQNSSTSYISYQITLTNSSTEDYTISNLTNISSYDPAGVGTVDYEYIGISNGDTIAGGASKTFTLNIYYNRNNNSSPTVTLTSKFMFDANIQGATTGTILASFIGNTTGNLRGKAYAPFTFEVTSTYTYPIDFTLYLDNYNFYLYSPANNFTIGANTTQQYNINIAAAGTAYFPNNQETVNVYFRSTGMTDVYIGQLTLRVKKS
jgi:hypothetical protein